MMEQNSVRQAIFSQPEPEWRQASLTTSELLSSLLVDIASTSMSEYPKTQHKKVSLPYFLD